MKKGRFIVWQMHGPAQERLYWKQSEIKCKTGSSAISWCLCVWSKGVGYHYHLASLLVWLMHHSISWISSMCLLMSMHGRWSSYKRLAQLSLFSPFFIREFSIPVFSRGHCGWSIAHQRWKLHHIFMGPVHKLMLENIFEVKSTETDWILWIH